MTSDPLTVGPDTQAAEALHLMEHKQITALAVVDSRGKVLGLVHLHDLLGRGAVSLNGMVPRQPGTNFSVIPGPPGEPKLNPSHAVFRPALSPAVRRLPLP